MAGITLQSIEMAIGRLGGEVAVDVSRESDAGIREVAAALEPSSELLTSGACGERSPR